MSKDTFFTGSKFEDEYGFSEAKRHGDTIYVSGPSGHNYENGRVSPEASEKIRQAFSNIESVLAHFELGFKRSVTGSFTLL